MNRKTKIAGAALLIAILAIAGALYYSSKTDNSKPLNESSFPKSLQGLTLKQVISGPQAIGMISKLHGTDISIKQGYIATYGGNNSQIMVWISESPSEKDAVKLFQIMDQRISESQNSNQSGGPSFTDRQILKVMGMDVVSVKGMGMENYYYQIGNKVYWVAVGGVNPSETLNEVMNAFGK